MDLISLLIAVAGVAAAVAAIRLWPNQETRLLDVWLRTEFPTGPWRPKRGFGIGLMLALHSPRRGDADVEAIGFASAGVSDAQATAWLALGARLAPVALLLTAFWFASSWLLFVGGLVALGVAWMSTRRAASVVRRLRARLVVVWLLGALAIAGMAALGAGLGDLRVPLTPFGMVLDALVYLLLGAVAQALLARRSYVIGLVAGFSGAGWVDTSSAAAVLVGIHFGTIVRLLALARRERAEARIATFTTAMASGVQGGFALLLLAWTLPLLDLATGSPAGSTAALFAFAAISWLSAAGIWKILAEPVDDWLRFRAGEGGGCRAPSLRLGALILRGVEWRAEQLGRMSVKLAESILGGKGINAFRLEGSLREAEEIQLELTAVESRRARTPLHKRDSAKLKTALTRARARGQLVEALVGWAKADGEAKLGQSGRRELDGYALHVSAFISHTYQDCSYALSGAQEVSRRSTTFEQNVARAVQAGALSADEASRLSLRAADLHRIAELVLQCVESPSVVKQPVAEVVEAEPQVA